VNFANSTDQSLLIFYESVRRQVHADVQTGGRYRFVGEHARHYEKQLRDELKRRGISFAPINWTS
jgi:hypothetical protein